MASVVETARTARGKRVKPYPKKGSLMISRKTVVLVTGYGNNQIGYPCFSGVVLQDDAGEDSFGIGFYSRTWTLDAFEPFNFKINFH